MYGKIEKTIPEGPYLDRYRKRCRNHPWYAEARDMIHDNSEKFKREFGHLSVFDPEYQALLDGKDYITVDEAIEYAKLTLKTPDMLAYWQEHIDEKKKHGEHRVSDEFLELLRDYEKWFFLRQGKEPRDIYLFAGRMLLGEVLDGTIVDPDSEEARAFVRKQEYVKDEGKTS